MSGEPELSVIEHSAQKEARLCRRADRALPDTNR